MALKMDDMKLVDMWQEFAGDKSDMNWIIYEVNDDKELVVTASGSGGYNEFAGNLAEDRPQFCGLKVIAIDRRENLTGKRPKVVNIGWIGGKTKMMKKARAGMQHQEVSNKIFTGCTCTVNASTLDEVSRDALRQKLLACGGAHKPSHYQFGPDDEIDVGFYRPGTDQ